MCFTMVITCMLIIMVGWTRKPPFGKDFQGFLLTKIFLNC